MTRKQVNPVVVAITLAVLGIFVVVAIAIGSSKMNQTKSDTNKAIETNDRSTGDATDRFERAITE